MSIWKTETAPMWFHHLNEELLIRKHWVMRHKTLSCHPRNYELDSLTLLKGVHPPIFLPYLMGTVSVLKTNIKKCDSTALTTYFCIVRAVLSQTYPLFLPYLMGAVSVLKTDIKGGRLPHSMREMSTRWTPIVRKPSPRKK